MKERHYVLLRSARKVIICNTVRNNLIWTYLCLLLGKHIIYTWLRPVCYTVISNIYTNARKERDWLNGEEVDVF
jgi:hypothetical protein